jgi:hypothetical protein
MPVVCPKSPSGVMASIKSAVDDLEITVTYADESTG